MVTFLLGNLEHNGRLLLSEEQAAQYSGGTEADAAAALSLLRGLAPAGVCAPSLRECLLTQLRQLPCRNAAAERLAGAGKYKLSAAAESLDGFIRQCNYNIGVGHLLGALAVELGG